MTVLPMAASSTLFCATATLKSLYEIRFGRRYALSTCWTSRTAQRPRMRYPNESLSFFFSPSITAKLRRISGAGDVAVLLPLLVPPSRQRNRAAEDSMAPGTIRGTRCEGHGVGTHAV